MSAIEIYNPDGLMLRTDLLISVNTSNRAINLIRPNADFLWLLRKSIDHGLASSHRPESSKVLMISNYSIYLLIVAARERMMSDEDARWVEEHFEGWKTTADIFLTQYQLFRSVAILAAALQAEIPEVLRDERKAWGRSVLRVMEANIHESLVTSANEYSRGLKNAAKMLSLGKNPFSDSEPEMRDLIVYAQRLSFFVESDLNHLKSLKKQVRQALDRFRRSLVADANSRRNDKSIHQTFVADRRHYIRGIKNHSYIVRYT